MTEADLFSTPAGCIILNQDNTFPPMIETKHLPTSTVGRSKALKLDTVPRDNRWTDGDTHLFLGDSLTLYEQWDRPTVIVSDGAYGILGFEGDTSDHLGVASWYEPHVAAWSRQASAQTTLWFWNSEIGWAAAHPILEKHGWRYVNANFWNKGKAHIAGNVNTAKIRRFPVVSEICVQNVFEARIGGDTVVAAQVLGARHLLTRHQRFVEFLAVAGADHLDRVVALEQLT